MLRLLSLFARDADVIYRDVGRRVSEKQVHSKFEKAMISLSQMVGVFSFDMNTPGGAVKGGKRPMGGRAAKI
jgi:hypothetical protein